MRYVSALLAIALLPGPLATASAAPADLCFRIFPVEVIECKDVRLTKLHDELERIYANSLRNVKGRRRQILVRDQQYWLRTRGDRCGIPVIEWVTSQEVRRVRPCLIRAYNARIAKLSGLTSRTITAKVRSSELRRAKAGGDQNDPEIRNANVVLHSDDLTVRKRFWEEQAFYCKSGDDIYPAKQDDPYDPMRRYDPAIPKSKWEKDYISETGCDDGDMTFFNSLLCSRSEEHTSELQSLRHLVCRLLLEKKT